MTKNKELKVDWILTLAVGLLILIGLAYLYSAIIANITVSEAVKTLHTNSILNQEFAYQLFIGVGLGLGLGYLFYRLDYHKLLEYSTPLMWTLLILLAIIAIPVSIANVYARAKGLSTDTVYAQLSQATHGFLFYANNSIRWIKVGFTIQPAELAKIILLVFVAATIDRFKDANWQKYRTPVFLGLAAVGMILIQPDLGSVVVIMGILLSSLWVAGIRVRFFATLTIVAALFGVLFISTASYRNVRVVTWAYQNFCSDINLNAPPPKSEQKGICKFFDFNKNTVSSYQTDQIRTALATGGFVGVGYNRGNLKTIIPEVRTDGIIGVIGEENGMLMVLLVMICYATVFFRGLWIAEHAPDRAGKILATGIAVWFAFQSLWNITGMTGLIPMKGLTLPLLSEGNSSMIVSLIAIGILLNIGTQTTVAETRKVRHSSNRNKASSKFSRFAR